MGGKYIFNSAHTVPERKLILHKMVASLDLVMRTTVCYRKTEITMRVSAILIDLPCYSVLETGRKKMGRGLKSSWTEKATQTSMVGRDLHSPCGSLQKQRTDEDLPGEPPPAKCWDALQPLPPNPAVVLSHPPPSCLPLHPHYRKTFTPTLPQPEDMESCLCTWALTCLHTHICSQWIFTIFFPAEIIWLLNSHWDFFIHFCFAAARV